MNAALDSALLAAMRGSGPDTVALMRILGEATSEDEAREAFGRARSRAGPAGLSRLDALEHLWKSHPAGWTIVRATLAGAAHDGTAMTSDATLRYWAAAFDRLVAASPEASVALYSLGSPDLLRIATDDVAAAMDRLGLLAPTVDGLDLGCGIGRFLSALAPRVRSMRGLDIAAGMVAEARARCAGLANITVDQASGHDMAAIMTQSLDLVLAADVFPYLVQAGGGVAARHIADIGRVLRPGGAAFILNYSYRGDVGQDEAEIAAHAAASHLRLERVGLSDFAMWDAASFLLRRPA